MDSKSSKIGRRFEGKVAIVTASTQGIGFSIAQRLALEGASVVISSRRQGKRRKGTVPVSCEEEMSQDLETFKEQSLRFERNVDEAVKKLKQQGIEVLGVVCHVSNAQQRKSLVEQTVQKYGKIDVIVSNAAANPSIDAILDSQESTLDKLWEINIKTAILLLQDASPHLTKGSSIVFISSLSAYQPPSSMAMYGVTKTALLGLTKALATEMAPHTRVNCVAPGTVPTHFASFITENDTIRNAIEEKTLLKRLGTPEDMAAATAFLASDEASYITGETIVVAGGMSSRL
ncbi:glucose/ribitol dehydrogenase [Artemisia annua]|uniref:Glucose/ribitol dehydrogenase n=1 Tax=Artemisia annua TaxID=35608 RepID=A0A2U1M767_ARTAN|nr:glucose/ribitol dehydrogenase [Artemisia annua]